MTEVGARSGDWGRVFTPEGLPVGIQIMGRHGDDFGVLQLTHAFEGVTEFWRHHPPLARDARL
jgi:Asp-tRNA(Asn)/Glu-tRNA(Gln) amidotransferase A subunit family amidase